MDKDAQSHPETQGLIDLLWGFIADFVLSIFELLKNLGSWAYENPDKAGLIALIPIFLGFFGYSGKVFSFLLSPLTRRKASALSIRSVPNSHHSLFDDFIEAYHDAFSEDERVATAEMIRWSDGEYTRHNSSLLYRNDVVYRGKDVVAFCNFLGDKRTGIIYIGHFGVVASVGKFGDQKKVYSLCLSRILRDIKKWRYVVFELDDPELSSGEEKRRRQARIRRFEGQAKMLGRTIKYYPFKYWFPTFSTDGTTREWGTSLLGIIVSDEKADVVSKEDVREIFDLLYGTIYRNCIGSDALDEEKFDREVEEIMMEFERECPATLRLR